MIGRTVSHKFTFGANGLIRITIEFQMTDIDPHPANARNTWLAARNVAYKHALHVRGIRRPALQNARTGHSNRQLGANRLSRRRAEGAYKAVFCWLSAAASSRKPSCRRTHLISPVRARYPLGYLIVLDFNPPKHSTAFTCRHTELSSWTIF